MSQSKQSALAETPKQQQKKKPNKLPYSSHTNRYKTIHIENILKDMLHWCT